MTLNNITDKVGQLRLHCHSHDYHNIPNPKANSQTKPTYKVNLLSTFLNLFYAEYYQRIVLKMQDPQYLSIQNQ